MKITDNYYFRIFIFGLIIILIVKANRSEEFGKTVPRNTQETQNLFKLIKLYELNDGINHGVIKFPNGDIIIEFIGYEGEIRSFFGLKANGKYLYGDENIISADSFINIQYTSIESYFLYPFIIKDENNKEYIVSEMGSSSSTFYFDINDLENKNLHRQEIKDIFTLQMLGGYIIPIEIKENNNYYTIICGKFYVEGSSTYYFKLYKISIAQEGNPIILKSSLTENIVVDSDYYNYCCYNIEAEKIICFILNISGLTRYIFNYQT